MGTSSGKFLYECGVVLIAAVWMINGLYCKVLNRVPRHRLIVARILGPAYAARLTTGIGLAEIGMAVWILSGFYSRLSTLTQLGLVGVMNALEFVLAPDLLLFGRRNAAVALLFMTMVYVNEFVLHPQIS